MTSTIKIVLAAWLLASIPTLPERQHNSQDNHKIKAVESRIAATFPIADSTSHLFAVNADYILQAVYDKSESLIGMRVAPKYSFIDSHPNWVEPETSPHLSKQDFRQLLERIAQVHPLGRLRMEGRVSAYVTNDQSPAIDEYENAFIYRSMKSRRLAEPDEFEAKSLQVFFSRLISGRLDRISKPNKAVEKDEACTIRIEGESYFASHDDCKSLKVGHRISVRAAGPITGTSD